MRLAAVVNFLLFQACWFAAILGAAGGATWLGPVAVAAFAAVHLLMTRRRHRRVWLLLLAAAAVGFVADSALVLAGVMDFPAPARSGAPTTWWMVALWVNLAATLHGVMSWLRGRLVLAALLGAVAGPLAYVAGARLGAVTLGEPTVLSVAAVAAEWLLALPLLAWMADRVDGPDRSAEESGTPAAAVTAAEAGP